MKTRKTPVTPRYPKPTVLTLALASLVALSGCHGNGSSTAASAPQTPAAPTPVVKKQPNILYIMADDLGYSDIHAFGGEISTPNLDALVTSGRILTDHHTGTVCAITRSMLISGTDHHLVGEGTMGAPNDERRGLPGYEGYLNNSSLSVAELLQDAGYHTYMAGKWHIGSNIASASNKTPDQWGFEQSFALLPGAAGNHFGHETATSKNYTYNGVYVHPGQPNQPGGLSNADGSAINYYSTNFFTQELISFIDLHTGANSDGKPFFAYAAYTSPHWPLAVPDPWLHQYAGVYDVGYDVIRNARIARQKELGIIPQDFTPYVGAPEATSQSPATANNGTASAKYISAVHSAADGYVDYRAGFYNKSWNSLSPLEKKAQARYMEIYAGMVSNLDYNIGLLIQHLKDIGEYDNTFIMFQSDNGAEGWPISSGNPQTVDEANATDPVYSTLGGDSGSANAKSIQYGLRWAEVSATPFGQWKGYSGEGGVSTPLIIHLPGQTTQSPSLNVFTHVTDNTATFLAVAGVTPPSDPAPVADNTPGVQPKVLYKGNAVYPITGKSLLPLVQDGVAGPVHTDPFGDEAYGRGYLVSADGKWKALWTEPPTGPLDGHWELFDLSKDRGENVDVSKQNPDVIQQLYSQWNAYLSNVGGVEPLRPQGYY